MNKLTIEPGTPADLEALSALHYRGGPPATVDLVLRCIAPDDGAPALAGVLVVSRPVLNAPWPGTRDRFGAVEITLVAGYASAAAIPPARASPITRPPSAAIDRPAAKGESSIEGTVWGMGASASGSPKRRRS